MGSLELRKGYKLPNLVMCTCLENQDTFETQDRLHNVSDT